MILRRFILIFCIFCSTSTLFGQNTIDLKAEFDVLTKTIHINQQITYKNTSYDVLNTIYLNDWNNSYSTKNTALAKRFSEEFNDKIHFAKSSERGFTKVNIIRDLSNNHLEFNALKNNPDVIKVTLNEPLLPNESYTITLNYNVVLPDAKFTNNGITKNKNFNLKYWYITPAVYDGKWQYYSNKNLDDLYVPKADLTLEILHPTNYIIVSELNTINTTIENNVQTTILNGKDRINSELILTKFSNFKFVQTDNFTIVSNINNQRVSVNEKVLIKDKITRFITEQLGAYPHQKLLLSDIEYKKDPVYGLNQLPSFLRPFPDNFNYEMQLLKSALKKYLDNTLLTNPRKDYWLNDGLQIYYLMKYIEEFYPDTKLLGSLAKIWGIRSFHAADLNFNVQYNLLYMQMVRTNRDQALTISKDSLTKFNSNIAGKYKAGIGLKYLDDFINSDILEQTIKTFLDENKLKPTSSLNFESYIKKQTNKDIDWFFTDYIGTIKKIDFKIKDIIKTEDSVTLTIRNKRNNKMPVSLFTLMNDSILSKTWIENIADVKTITIPKNDVNKLVLNYDGVIPEFNLRDNWKSLKGFFFNNKPLQFRLFKDIEDPNYNQVFLMPLVEFKNIYDGLTLGLKMYNKTVLRKRLNYQFSPQYATKSKSLTGSTSIFYTHYIENKNLYNITYGFTASYSSFAQDAFVTRYSPNLSFYFRDDDDFRSNKRTRLSFRYLNISRDIGSNAIIENLLEPDYGVFNARLTNSNINLINYNRTSYDFQAANKFGKISFNYQYRKLLNSNQQFSFRLFAGAFLYNNTSTDSDYFSFALDRPTDYLFDYNYLGRSEASGIFSQQLIIAEGGFKSRLNPHFANQWITTANASASIWRYIQAYGDVGLVKNKNVSTKFVYDSGIKLNLVQDYFEIYFPVYSNLGWEIAQPNYDQKIRFIFTLDPQTLLGLFRRKWY